MYTVYDIFKQRTQYDILSFLNSFVSFVREDSIYILDFYTNKSDLNKVSFERLNFLLKEYDKIQSIIIKFSLKLDTNELYDLIDRIDDIGIKLDTINNYRKWARTNDKNENFGLTYKPSQYEKLEDVAQKLGYIDPQNSYVNFSISNNLSEIKYTFDDIPEIQSEYKNSNGDIILSVVGSSDGIKLYGLGIDKKITFENNDLKILNENKTIEQAANILLSLNKGDNPELPSNGTDRRALSNINQYTILLPSIIRQLRSTILNDDRFKDVSVLNIKKDQDAVFMEILLILKNNNTINLTV